MRRKIGFICMILGAALLIAALSLLIYNYLDNKRAGDAADYVLDELKYDIDESSGEGKRKDKNDNELSNSATPAFEIDGKYYIGILSIPVLNLELPVIDNWSYSNLKAAPCRYFGSAETDDMVIAGHNYSTHFGGLRYLSAGDEVVFTDAGGSSLYYKVFEVLTVSPTDIDEMISDGDLTLFTCNYSGQARIAVRCERIH